MQKSSASPLRALVLLCALLLLPAKLFILPLPEAANPAQPALSATDASAYRQLFTLQGQGRWAEADALLNHVSDPLLLGETQAQRYLSGGYHASVGELKQWLASYDDLPQYPRIYKLAQQKGATGLQPQPESNPLLPTEAQRSQRFSQSLIAQQHQWREGSPAASAWQNIRQLLRSNSPQTALAELQKNGHLFTLRDYDLVRWAVASRMVNNGNAYLARNLAKASADRSGSAIPALYWLAGLSQWQYGTPKNALRYFRAMADADYALTPADAAAAFWAHRAAEKLGDNALSSRYLHQAARYQQSFYGIVAQQELKGEALQESASALPQPAFRRIQALRQIGELPRAEAEAAALLRRAPANQTASLSEALQQNGFSESRLRQLAQATPHPQASTYLSANWEQLRRSGVDSALLLAIARQESGFNASLKSGAGASGMLQMMPETSRYLLARLQPGAKTTPPSAISLARHYVEELRTLPQINGNLIYLAAAYNAGPGTLQKWLKNQPAQDPLLFVESIPYPETRSYVLNIMTNYWMVNQVLGEPDESPASLLAGNWPVENTLRPLLASRQPALPLL